MVLESRLRVIVVVDAGSRLDVKWTLSMMQDDGTCEFRNNSGGTVGCCRPLLHLQGTWPLLGMGSQGPPSITVHNLMSSWTFQGCINVHGNHARYCNQDRHSILI